MPLKTWLLTVFDRFVYGRHRQYDDGTEIEMCTFLLDRHHYLTYYMADLVIFYVIPLFLTCLLYALIARILFMSTRMAGTPGSSSGSPDAHSTRSGAASCTTRIRRSTSCTSSRVQVHYYYYFLIPSVVKIPRVKNKVKNSVWS